MKTTSIILTSIFALVAGSILFLLDKEYIIIRIPQFTHTESNGNTLHSEKKEIIFYFWHHHQWLTEKKQCIWLADSDASSVSAGATIPDSSSSMSTKSVLESATKQINLKQLVITWLATLQAETGVATAHISLQGATLNPTGYVAYLSFDSSPLPHNSSMFEKLMLLEGLLKTIRTSGLAIQAVQFLQNHQPLVDTHLDFSQPWGVQGFAHK